MSDPDSVSLRDLFAGRALSQLSNTGRPAEEIARNCYALADAMLTYRGSSDFTPEHAHLYAAAPDLLESLRDVLSLVDRGVLIRDISRDDEWNWDSRQWQLDEKLSKAAQSLNKAEGK